MDNCEKSTTDIGRHDERLKNVENFMTAMLNNHLPHIQDELVAIKLQQAYWAGGLAVLITGLTLAVKFIH